MLTALQVEVNCAVMTELLSGYARYPQMSKTSPPNEAPWNDWAVDRI